MGQYKYSFIVSAIAILFSAGANAATLAVEGLATPNYVKGAVGALNAQLKAVAKSGSYNDLTNKPTIPAAQVNSDWNATTGKAQILNKPTLGALAAKSNVTNADISGTINQDKITGLSGALAGKQPTLTTGDSGNIKGGGSVTVTKNTETGVITISGTDTKYTLPAANGATLGGVKTGGDMTAASGTLTITNGKVTTAKIADGAVNSAKIADGSIVNADISSSAAIATSKISGLDTALNGKQLKTNIVNPNSEGKFATGEETSTDKYPSMKAATQIAANAVSIGTMDLSGRVDTLEDDYSTLSQTVETNKGEANNAIAALDGTGTGTTTGNGMVKLVTQTDGKVTATRETVKNADIATGVIAKDKLASAVQTSLGKADSALQSVSGGAAVAGKVATAVVESGTAVAVTMDYVKIPVGSPTSPTSVAQIWVQ